MPFLPKNACLVKEPPHRAIIRSATQNGNIFALLGVTRFDTAHRVRINLHMRSGKSVWRDETAIDEALRWAWRKSAVLQPAPPQPMLRLGQGVSRRNNCGQGKAEAALYCAV